MPESPYNPPKARIDPPPPANQQELERPKEILFAIWLTIAGHLLGWAGVSVSWDYQMSLQSPGQFLIGQAFGTVVAVWIYYKIYQGRNWARIVLLIFVVLGLVMLLVPMTTEILKMAPVVSKIIMVVNHLLNAVVLWLLFFSPGRHWFNKRLRHAAA